MGLFDKIVTLSNSERICYLRITRNFTWGFFIMELAILPILALLGIVFLVDFGGDDEASDPSEKPDAPEGKFNYMQFGPEDDVSGGTSEADSMYLDQGDDLARGGEGDDKIFLGDGQDATAELTQRVILIPRAWRAMTLSVAATGAIF